ncbi:ATP-binding protein [Algoriphagus boritolerans]|uniref:sensor histidine kinase n=1 Tax=Algoriphagus boritolerans TaxID=308111 RepID=UPI000B1A45C5
MELADEILSNSADSGEVIHRSPKEHEFSLSTLKTKLKDMYNPQAISKKVELEVKANPPFEEIPFPKNKILQILGNLISNAIKFTPTHGKIEVLLDMEVLDQIRKLVFKVKDNGVGIDQTKIEEIQAGGTNSSMGTSGEKGFGFGLNLVHHLVNSLKGKLNVKSELGKGTEFEFILPLD